METLVKYLPVIITGIIVIIFYIKFIKINEFGSNNDLKKKK